MNLLIDFLNFQPFGDHGVMSILSIHLSQIIVIPYLIYAIVQIIKYERSL